MSLLKSPFILVIYFTEGNIKKINYLDTCFKAFNSANCDDFLPVAKESTTFDILKITTDH